MFTPTPTITFSNPEEMNQKLRQINQDLDQGKWLNDRFETQNKSFRIVRILKSIVSIITGDLFAHVRIDAVAKNLFYNVKANRPHMNEDTKDLVNQILNKLAAKTKKNQNLEMIEIIKHAIEGIHAEITPTPTSITREKSGVIPPAPPFNGDIPLPPPYKPVAKPEVKSNHPPHFVYYAEKWVDPESKVSVNGRLVKVKDALKGIHQGRLLGQELQQVFEARKRAANGNAANGNKVRPLPIPLKKVN